MEGRETFLFQKAAEEIKADCHYLATVQNAEFKFLSTGRKRRENYCNQNKKK